jgi:hypothetical protein
MPTDDHQTQILSAYENLKSKGSIPNFIEINDFYFEKGKEATSTPLPWCVCGRS